jgi:hypothetical protein
MKYLFLAVLFSFSALAAEISFKCNFTDETFINQFSLEAKHVQYDEEGKFSNVEFDFSTRRAGRNVKEERLALTRSGDVTIFPAGEDFKFVTARVASAVKDAEVEYVNLLIDMPPLYTSQIRFLDGMEYYGSCKSL